MAKVRILLLEGSNDPKGNGAKLAAEFVKGVEGACGERGVEVTSVRLPRKKITPCTFCQGCWKNAAHKCRFDDDVPEILELVMASDIVVNVVPVWYWGAPGFVKSLLDRWTPLFAEGFGLRAEVQARLKGSVMATLCTCGDPDCGPMCQPVTFMYDGFLGFLPEGTIYNGGHVVAAAPVKEENLAEARKLGEKCFGMLRK